MRLRVCALVAAEYTPSLAYEESKSVKNLVVVPGYKRLNRDFYSVLPLALSCLRSKTQNQVLTALSQAMLQVVEPANKVYWEPVVDGLVIPDQPRTLFEAGAFHHVPTVIGINRDEGLVFVTRSFPGR